jgi:hypothetical protein
MEPIRFVLLKLLAIGTSASLRSQAVSVKTDVQVSESTAFPRSGGASHHCLILVDEFCTLQGCSA